MSKSITKQTISIYFRENFKYPGLFIATNLSWMSGMLLQKLLLPLIVARVFDEIITSQADGTLQWSLFTNDFILFIVIALIAQVAIDGGLLLLSKLETRVIVKLHTQIYDHLLSQSMNFHNNSFSGSLVNQTNRFVSAYVTITDTLVINLSQLIIFVIFSSVILFFYSPLIAGTILAWSILFVIVNVTLTRKRIPLSKARAAADTKLTGYLADSISNVSAIKTFAAEKYEYRKYKALSQNRARLGWIYWMRSIRNDAVFGIMMVTLQLLVLVVSIVAVQHNTITIGTLVLAQVYITQTISNLWGLSNITKNVEQNLSDAAEMTEILNIKPKIKDPTTPEQVEISDGRITFNDVTFTHTGDTDTLFHELNLEVKAGEQVGLIGRSGGGKTTLTKLLLRFADIDGGDIEIDGQDISNITQDDLRSHITYVPQEPVLFHRSLAENIGYGRPDASRKDIIRVAKMAHADEFIEKLPHGYDTLVGERGVKLSGGQRQRVAIARAMIKDAPILVLDEATSALDSESEVLIQDALWKLMEGRTAIVIAHRLSTIQKMDRIIVMDEGKIIEQGTHKELIANKGIYADLWNHQTGGFIED